MLYAIIFFAVVLLDQLTKAIVDMNNCNITIIPRIFSITNARNPGAAFGMMADSPAAMAIFISLTALSMIAVSVYFVIRKKRNTWLDLSLVFISAGAIGNFIDRLAFKEVRDFIFVHFFANFNVADIAVTVGGIMFVIYFFFLDKDAIFRKKPKKDANEQL